MPANTPNRGYTYATAGDANDLALISQRLAEQIDADVNPIFTAWQPYTPTLTGITLGNGTLHGAHKRIGRTVIFRAWLIWGSTTVHTSGAINLGLPVAASPLTSILGDGMVQDSSTGDIYQGLARGSSSTAAALMVPTAANPAKVFYAQAGVPMTWATGDVFSVTGTYEAAP